MISNNINTQMPNLKSTSATLLILTLVPLILTSQIVTDSSPSIETTPIVGRQREGNITADQKALLKILIDNSTELYRRYKLPDMAAYISQGMTKNYGDTWQVFIFGQGTDDCSFSSNTIVGNQWAIWSDYGIYDLCYVVYRTRSCLKGHNWQKQQPEKQLKQQQQWGYSFTDYDQQRILALLDQASIYSGDDMTLNAQYILSKIGPGGWGFAVGGPSNGIGMSTCYYKGYYAFIVDYTDLLWSYGIIRQY